MPNKDPQKKKAYSKQYEINRRAKKKLYNNEYMKRPDYHKQNTISSWRHYGVIETEYYTFDELYEAYLYCSECEECGVELTTGKRCSTSKCLDHDHTTGLFRNILCMCCNVRRR